jgi:hypothetical protein
MGNAESLTGVQQWLLMYVMAKHTFDLVDIMLAKIEDAIMDQAARDDATAALRSLDQLAVVPP